MKFPLKTAAGAVCLLAAIASPPLRAGQPASIDVAIETRLARYGSSFLHVVNNAREPYIIVFRAGPQSSIPIRFTRVELGPSAIADLDLGQLQFTGGVEVLDIVSTVSMGGEGEFAAGPSLLQVLKVGPSSVVPTTYEAAFLSKRRRVEGDSRPSPVDIGGGYMDVRPIGALSYESIPGTSDARAVPLDYPSVYAMSDMRPKQLPDFSAPPTGLARIAGQQEESLRGEAGGRMTAGAGPAAAAVRSAA